MYRNVFQDDIFIERENLNASLAPKMDLSVTTSLFQRGYFDEDFLLVILRLFIYLSYLHDAQ